MMWRTMAPLGCQNTNPGPAASLMLNSSNSAPSFRWSLHGNVICN